MAEGAVPARGPQVDPLVLEDIRCVEHYCTLLGRFGVRARFWEVFTLLKTARTLLVREMERLAKAEDVKATLIDETLLGKLKHLQREYGLLAERLHTYLIHCPVKIDHSSLELATVFMMSNAQGRQAAARWLEDPAGSAAEAGIRVRIMGSIADAYRKALVLARSEAVPTLVRPAPEELPEPVAAEAPAPPEPSLPEPAPPPVPQETVRRPAPPPPEKFTAKKINPEFLQNLRYLEACRQLLDGVETLEGWEVLYLLVSMREETAGAIKEMARLKKLGKKGEFAGEAYRFREKLQGVRAHLGVFVQDLRGYFSRIFGGWTGDTQEIALTFLVASTQGRHRAKQWLEDPELCKEEASNTLVGLMSRARMYQDALIRAREARSISPPS